MTDIPALPFAAVILDMDGLVVDTESTYCHAWQQAARNLDGAYPEEFLLGLFGLNADDVKIALREAWGPGFQEERFHEHAARHWQEHLNTHGIAWMPGLDRLLSWLKSREIPYALATNSDALHATLCLRRAGLEAEFPVRVTRDQVALGKPAPDLFLEAARRLGRAPASCLVLEDSGPGLTAARAAETRVVLVQRDTPRRERMRGMADAACASLHEVAEWLQHCPNSDHAG
jgi:HAD superfamily hydrolase (TIGR01509 family)